MGRAASSGIDAVDGAEPRRRVLLGDVALAELALVRGQVGGQQRVAPERNRAAGPVEGIEQAASPVEYAAVLQVFAQDQRNQPVRLDGGGPVDDIQAIVAGRRADAHPVAADLLQRRPARLELAQDARCVGVLRTHGAAPANQLG